MRDQDGIVVPQSMADDLPCSEPTTPVRRKWQLILVNPAHDSGVVDEYLCFILSFTPYAPCHMNTSSSNKLLREL
jgi:hypothetical protein